MLCYAFPRCTEHMSSMKYTCGLKKVDVEKMAASTHNERLMVIFRHFCLDKRQYKIITMNCTSKKEDETSRAGKKEFIQLRATR
jgi:hypothetical protein